MFADLTKGFVGLLSPGDADWFIKQAWHAHRYQDGYWGMKAWGSKKLHRLLLGITDPAVLVDHRNGNPFDNRRGNLRVCTNADNVRNQKGHRDKKYSRFKGVTWMGGDVPNPWLARIQHNRKALHIGVFPTARDAALAYDEAALRLHGAFARTNAMLGLL